MKYFFTFLGTLFVFGSFFVLKVGLNTLEPTVLLAGLVVFFVGSFLILEIPVKEKYKRNREE